VIHPAQNEQLSRSADAPQRVRFDRSVTDRTARSSSSSAQLGALSPGLLTHRPRDVRYRRGIRERQRQSIVPIGRSRRSSTWPRRPARASSSSATESTRQCVALSQPAAGSARSVSRGAVVRSRRRDRSHPRAADLLREAAGEVLRRPAGVSSLLGERDDVRSCRNSKLDLILQTRLS